jgi:glycerol-3-phosphate acyltransferase PlsY
MMMPFLVLAAAYLLGSVPFGYLLVRARSGRDVRAMGSGNIGATNVLRTSGRGLAVLTLLLDILKGLVAVWLAQVALNG